MGSPNLFILGAGKCGTTSLYHLFERHPDIAVSPVKEPSFFCSHFQVVSNPIEYFNLFDNNARFRVDASHVYLSNPETAPVLKDLFPDAKFILTFRDPKARAHSLFQHMRRSRHVDGNPFEPIEQFHDALVAEEERATSRCFAEECRQYYWNFLYMRSSCYDAQLERYFALYPRENFFVTTLAEMTKNSDGIIKEISNFLGIDMAGFGSDMPLTNVAPDYDSFSPECDAIMEGCFGDLTSRVDRIVGRSLDWSI
ncbi:sulfotransferase domain-containing protein [uncultured Methylobacterium sp.]|uniref:sulfotransferase domain-containing protein n=1 Tax=uncultured Methylobacterium sp. TaxID=157278 RepID=UPI0025837FB9|nr:sulfotransferase domain-containing protein [uncultured Methylobacterium sp.]